MASCGITFATSHTMMEKLSNRLESYSTVLNLLDGIRSLSNVNQEYSGVLNVVRQVHKEIDTLQTNLSKAKILIAKQKEQAETLVQLKKRMNHLIANRHFFETSGCPRAEKGITPETSFLSFNSLVPKSSPLPINTPSTLTQRNKLQVSTQQLEPPTPKPLKDLQVAIAYISHADFANVPSYMKGRIRYEEINSFVDLFNSVLNKKTSIWTKPKKAPKTKREQDLLLTWKEQIVPELVDKYFLSVKDFELLNSYKLSKKDYTILTILRHVQRLKELRVKKVIYYVACF